ncbi:MAG: alpha-L-rhamnosidase N-terminal domain-containing protein, partial [Tannerella sp.]|nr:alpha-L-rhamnosidase N-terminal domain-containing protein [Tannerella sp.]
MYKVLVLFFSAILACCTNSADAPYDLRVEYLCEPLSVDTPHPRLSWKNVASSRDFHQTDYQVIVASKADLLREGKADLWDSGEVMSDEQIDVRYAGKSLLGQRLVYWKVRVRDNRGKWSNWSATARFGAGLSEEDITLAEYIGLPKNEPLDGDVAGNVSTNQQDRAQQRNPAPLVRKAIDYKGGTTLLYVNSLGYHEVYINGRKIGDAELQPAVSQYDKRSLYNTYDITRQLRKGANELVVWLG